MNVALIMERIEPWRGGAETSTLQVANALARAGCTISVLTTSPIPSTPTLTIVPIKANSTLRLSRTATFARRAAACVRQRGFDVVHCITPCPAADVYQPRGGTVPEMLQRNLAIRSSALPRGLKSLGQRMRWKYRVLARLERQLLIRPSPPWVIAISRYVHEQLSRHYRFDPRRVREIFNAVDPDVTPAEEREVHRRDIRLQFGLATEDLFVLCVAHNFKLKGVGKLIQAIAQWETAQGSRPGAASRPGRTCAVIVGRDNPAPYVRLAQQWGVADRILFAGPTQRIGAFFHAADLLVHPTYYDPCSRVVLEALAAGLPVITTRFNGAAERITDGREGYVIASPADVDALAERIGRLADESHRRACSRHAAQAVRDITVDRHAREVLALYEEIVRSRRRCES